MSNGTILYFAIGVFTLMAIGIALTGLEFRKLNAAATARKKGESHGE
jgi:ABC-type long-subunit fatty acid transport system fused permease/ATPase subunit